MDRAVADNGSTPPNRDWLRAPQRFAFVLIPNFSMIAFTSAIEPVRIANRISGRELYGWQVVSKEGGPVRASNGVLVYTDQCLADVDRVPVQRTGACDVEECPKVYVPVCSEDGNTFANACEAEAAGTAIFTEGACNVRACPRLYVPVCGADELTYGNACQAERKGVRIRHAGLCETEGQRNCPRIYQPVCARDGNTYSNSCQMENAEQELAYAGQCLGQ